MQLSLTDIRELAERILRHHGFTEGHVQAVADTVVRGQRDECHSHGLYRLLGIVATLKAGKGVADAEPEVIDHAPAVVKVNAHGGFSPLSFRQGLPLLVDKARSGGIAAMAINNCVHFSALWVEIEALVEQGLVAMAFTPSHAWVAPAGGRKPVFGTNPIAFGWPRPGHTPYIFDFATSAIARGDIELHRRADKPIPLGWGVDAEGQPTTDANAVINGGSMLTFGGHKGSALSAMVELLAGPLIGDLTSAESLAFDDGSRSLPYHGELLVVFDPKRFLGDDCDTHLLRAESLFEGIIDAGARLPSQRRYEARLRSEAQGVELPDALYADLLKLLEA
ncbi:oxidoreductase [Pokkaliibacter plantistimulans]|uniref:Delta(1)-pyrroline-2-carboxylate/Delta(1)-piperideine-2-carboxylate reductase n=1 Tax=Proteobacteria bacterium 228 TaxID=2083153 RepID=A0A2S5KPD7_9PROT|nr:Ldh family oxidoreductase [Pokkaliibacter plantistimulans]PPC76543.1 oxidoreductase [Pokkaliibacter plantistimulans]